MTGQEVVAEHPITEERHVTRVDVPAATEVHMDLRFSKAILVFVRLYGPRGRLVAMATCMNGRDRIAIRLHPEAPTLNALPRAPLPGEYRVVIDTPLADHRGVGAEVRVAVSAGPGGTALPGDLIQQATFDEEGRAIGLESIRNPQRRYYRGDLHGHTTASDGLLDDEHAMRLLEREKLDYMAITEHNLVTFGHRVGPTVIVPAFELTLADGHLNVFGVDEVRAIERIWARVEEGEASIRRLIPELHDHGYLVSINHMFLRPWAFEASGLSATSVDTIEIMCDPTYPGGAEANETAIAFLDHLWSRGVRWYAVGGSDSHNPPDARYEGTELPSIYGDPSTWVHCDGLSVTNLIEGIRSGHSYIARFITLEISIADGHYLPGDCVPQEGPTFDYELRVVDFGLTRTSMPAMELTGQILINGEIVAQASLSPEQPTIRVRDVRGYVGARESWWLRASVREQSGFHIAYVNPVYCGEVVAPDAHVDTLIAEFRESYDQGRAL